MEMIEKVARAICEADTGRVTPNELARCQGLARAAIEAMRDATFEVYDAGVCTEITAFREERGQNYTTLENCHIGGPSINGVWQAMIDAALTSSP